MNSASLTDTPAAASSSQGFFSGLFGQKATPDDEPPPSVLSEWNKYAGQPGRLKAILNGGFSTLHYKRIVWSTCRGGPVRQADESDGGGICLSTAVFVNISVEGDRWCPGPLQWGKFPDVKVCSSHVLSPPDTLAWRQDRLCNILARVKCMERGFHVAEDFTYLPYSSMKLRGFDAAYAWIQFLQFADAIHHAAGIFCCFSWGWGCLPYSGIHNIFTCDHAGTLKICHLLYHWLSVGIVCLCIS